MKRNLMAEISRNDIKKKEIADHLHIGLDTFNDKLSGKSQFKLSEALEIREAFFPDVDFLYLFAEIK